MAEWFTVEGDTPEEATAAQERLAAAWVDAPLDNLEVCAMLLNVAKTDVLDFAPDPADEDDAPDPLPDPPVIPERYVLAQLQQAINLWNAGRVSSDGTSGMDTFTFTPRPLDKTIRKMIRPTKGLFSVG
ncbi:hypothetical protein [Parafrigoribacterium humi]|uniref:hypothetical protein n=1 Tax=Parafrigoribacterium humi TaxID=3144664 RepID=UPI0032EFBCC5